MIRQLAVLASFAIASPTFAAQQDPSPTHDPQVQASPEPSPTPETRNEGNLIRRSLRHFLRDDDHGSEQGVHRGPVYPRVAIVSAGGGPAPVIHLWGSNIRSTPIDFHASAAYSVFKYQYYDAQFGMLPHEGEKLPRFETSTNAVFPLADLDKGSGAAGFSLYASARYRDFPREDFYGVGDGSSRDRHSDYRLKDRQYEGVIRLGGHRLSTMARAGLLQTTIGAGLDSGIPNTETLFTPASAPGLVNTPDFLFGSVGAWLELRDVVGNPHKGAAFGGAYSRFDDRKADVYKFDRVSLEGREYLPLGSHRHVLAFRELLVMDKPADGRAIPFYLRTTLGGGSSFRGYSSFRFRDDRLFYLTGEYRFEATPKVELAFIYEAGKVFPESEGVNFDHLRKAWGGGLRLKSPKKVHARLDVVHGDEGTRVHAKLSRSF